MKLLKNRGVYAVLAFILAAVIAFVIIPHFYDQHEATVNVVKPAKTITAGTVITSDMLTTVKLSASGVFSGSVSDPAKIVGKVPTKDLDSRNPIYKDEVCSKKEYQSTGSAAIPVAEDQYLVSVSMPSAAAAVSGLVGPGGHVDVCYAYTSKTPDASGNYTTAVMPDLLKGMTVYSVMNNSLTSVTAAKLADKETVSAVPSIVTLIANQKQADLLIQLENSETDKIQLISCTAQKGNAK